MEVTVPFEQIKTKFFFFARIFDITLHVIISGIGMREKRGIQRHRGERGGGREEARDTERIRPIKGCPPHPMTYHYITVTIFRCVHRGSVCNHWAILGGFRRFCIIGNGRTDGHTD